MVRLESIQYPYTLTVPAEEVLAPFKPATTAWDGMARVTRDRPFVDVIALSDGFVFIVGVEWPEDVESLAQMYIDGEQQNGCSQGKNQQEVTVGGASAVAFTVDSCGPENATFARVAALHDGFGLIAFTPTSSGKEAADIDALVESLAGLEWRTA
jgi:hypothetical protein